MSNDPPTAPATVTATVRLSTDEWNMQLKVSVPAGPTRLRQVLPMVQALADAVVGGAVEAAEGRGEEVSCKKGCGACCRQLVPVAEVEARHVRDVVESLPEPRRSAIRARFADARRRLDEAGLLGKLLNTGDWADGQAHATGEAYFRQGIPCPFLENESCSIYADRPVACREYLVTSPAENCARPSAESVRLVPLPLKVWTSLALFDEVPPGQRCIRWLPLVLAPDWAEAHPDEPPARPGPELLCDLFDYLTRKKGPKGGAEAPPVSPALAAAPGSRPEE